MPPDDPLLLTPQAASYCRLTPRTMENKRVAGDGPPFIRIGRAVRYRKSALDAWLASREVRSTSEADALDERSRTP